LTIGDKGQLTAKVDPAGTAVTWSSDKEEIATVDANGLVTAVAAGTAVITATANDGSGVKATCTVTVVPATYMKWDAIQKKLVATDIPANATNVSSGNSGVNWSAGTYVVEGDITIGGEISLSGDVELIIKDGAKLTVNGIINGNDKNALNIYGQSEMTGQLIVNHSSDVINNIKTLEVHSCNVKATSSRNDCCGFYAIKTFNVYGGSVEAECTGSYGYGISLYSNVGKMNIYGGDVKAVGKGTETTYSYGIRGGSGTATVTVYGGKLWVENPDYQALKSGVTLTKETSFTGKIEYSSDKSDWSETADPSAKYVRVGY
jgi:hypothetical protein